MLEAANDLLQIVIDENIFVDDKGLRYLNHHVQTRSAVFIKYADKLKNGLIVEQMVEDDFHYLVTKDKNYYLELSAIHQQLVRQHNIYIAVIYFEPGTDRRLQILDWTKVIDRCRDLYLTLEELRVIPVYVK